MSLRKQLFHAFLTVAIVPLLVVGIYIFATNLMVTFDLYKQNLEDSTLIQVNLIEDSINRLMVRARQFTSSRAVQQACRDRTIGQGNEARDIAKDIQNFTDETLDSVAVFALLDQEGTVLYSSGSNSDSQALMTGLQAYLSADDQYVSEVFLAEPGNQLLINTPVRENGRTIGSFLVICRTDYFLKLISGHRQMDSTNVLIYCRDHQQIVTSKLDFSDAPPVLVEKIDGTEQSAFLCELNEEKVLVYPSNISKTPWTLISLVSREEILSRIWIYGLIHMLTMLAVLLIVIFLSQRQSKRMLFPMDQLLGAVEKFFLVGESRFPKTDIDPKSEIGYLEEKFKGMSQKISLAQGKLKESNYLYAALLQATFEFRIVMDFQSDKAECSLGALAERLSALSEKTMPEQVMSLLTGEDRRTEAEEKLADIVYGRVTEPTEAEAHFSIEEGGEKNWYRIVAVPVIQEASCRMVLHFEDISEQKREEQRLIESSQTDYLCGVFNRTAFPHQCTFSGAGKTDALFFIDLDHFKQVNDTLGHAAGDQILVATAHAIRAQFRKNDIVGRFGGDEFMVFVPGISKPMAEQKGRRLLETISFYLETPMETEIHVTASIGICLVVSDITLDETVRIADKAMYEAKRAGRSQFFLIQSDEDQKGTFI